MLDVTNHTVPLMLFLSVIGILLSVIGSLIFWVVKKELISNAREHGLIWRSLAGVKGRLNHIIQFQKDIPEFKPPAKYEREEDMWKRRKYSAD